MKPLISLCIPVLNEEGNVHGFYRELTDVLAQYRERYDYEFVITDNHSTDRTFELLAELALTDPRVRVLRFSRNFGFQRSVLTGFCEARGACAIQVDADLQDPPTLIHNFIAEWEKGAKVVYGIRRQRKGDAWYVHAMRLIFYRLIDFLSDDHLPHDAGDFRLIDRVILDQLKLNLDQTPYVRGQIAAMGFRQVGIPYDRESRKAGVTKFSFFKLIGLALDGILNHSTTPLRIATFTGLGFSALAFLGMFYFVVMRIFFRHDWPEGLAALSVMILFMIGLNALFLGILGEYIGRIYLNSRSRPIVIVENRIDNGAADSRGKDT
jgi:polyisoprenyl-phosphate glycosyltransferase